MAANLNKIWAKAQPLSDYFAALQRDIPTSQSLSDMIPDHMDEDTAVTGLAKTLRNISGSMAVHAIANEKRSKALTALRESLIAGDIHLIGIIEGTLQILSEDFWLTAALTTSNSSAANNECEITELRVLDTGALKAERSTLTQGPRRKTPIPKNPKPRPGGATSFASKREAVIRECYTRNPDFDNWKMDKRLQYIRGVAEEMFPGIDTCRGFGRSSTLETIKRLRESGHLSSDNVQ